VDLGGRPRIEDTCIFRACTHTVLLIKDGEEQAVETWRNFTTTSSLCLLAEIRSQLTGESHLNSSRPVITGTMTGLIRGQTLHNDVFTVLIERICDLFGAYSEKELEKGHLDAAPQEVQESIVHLRQQLAALAPDADVWTPDLLAPLLADLPEQTPLAVYERAPNWVYGTLALHTGTKPFYQFDSCLNWINPPLLQSSASILEQELIQIDPLQQRNDASIITIRLLYSYIDYEQTNKLILPEPPPGRGIIINGQLPLWLFTSLARFYAQRNVPWIALNDASTRKPVVIWSQWDDHFIGEELDMLLM
jgi:CRISPR-associated protein Csx3